MVKSFTLSVHELVDFLLRTGDIDNRINNSATMNEGTAIHAYYQAKQGNDYLAEYECRETFKVEDYEITLEGRADGIVDLGNSAIIEEIKSTIAPLDEYYKDNEAWHLGQAKCYALMYAHEKGYKSVKIKLTYYHQLDKSQLVKTYEYLTSELEKDIFNLLKDYISFFEIILENKIKSIEQSVNKKTQNAKLTINENSEKVFIESENVLKY